MHPDYTLTQIQFHKKYIAPTLEIMGFEHQGSGMYFNILLQKLFDFSSYSLEECIVAVYQAGLKRGKEEKEEEIKKAFSHLSFNISVTSLNEKEKQNVPTKRTS